MSFIGFFKIRPALVHQTTPKSPSQKHMPCDTLKNAANASPVNKRHNLAHLNLTPTAPDPVIVHPVVVVAILHLIPSIHHDTEKQVLVSLIL